MLPKTGIIIFCNNDLTPGVQGPLSRQLYIDEAITGKEFDLRVAADPNYPQIVHLNNIHLLVLRDFGDGYVNNRDLADVAIFIKAGLAAIEGHKYGPPGETLPVDTLTLDKLFKHYPIHPHRFECNPNVQNNILVPLHPHKHRHRLYPFGSDSGEGDERRGGRGADILKPEDK